MVKLPMVENVFFFLFFFFPIFFFNILLQIITLEVVLYPDQEELIVNCTEQNNCSIATVLIRSDQVIN